MAIDYTSRGGMCSDLDAPACPLCGSPAIRSEYCFDIREEKRKRNARIIPLERRAYYHCQNGCVVTEWRKPVYDTDNATVRLARELAREDWDRAVNRIKRKEKNNADN